MISGSKTRQEIAREYGWNRKTFYRKTKDLNLGSGLLNPEKIIVIYRRFGIPPNLSKKEYEYYFAALQNG